MQKKLTAIDERTEELRTMVDDRTKEVSNRLERLEGMLETLVNSIPERQGEHGSGDDWVMIVQYI